MQRPAHNPNAHLRVRAIRLVLALLAHILQEPVVVIVIWRVAGCYREGVEARVYAAFSQLQDVELLQAVLVCRQPHCNSNSV
jgi:ribosomal protein S24E